MDAYRRLAQMYLPHPASSVTVIILVRGCVPRVLLNRFKPGLHAVHFAREMVRN